MADDIVQYEHLHCTMFDRDIQLPGSIQAF